MGCSGLFPGHPSWETRVADSFQLNASPGLHSCFGNFKALPLLFVWYPWKIHAMMNPVKFCAVLCELFLFVFREPWLLRFCVFKALIRERERDSNRSLKAIIIESKASPCLQSIWEGDPTPQKHSFFQNLYNLNSPHILCCEI